MTSTLLILLRLIPLFAVAHAGCTDGGHGGCGPPVGEKWDTWAMAASTYTYCYQGCVVDWLYNNTAPLGLNTYAGVVGVDHYWTHQGMPCVDGNPTEFAQQDALAQKWKSKFPDVRMLQYRILSAVPYDMVVQNKILHDKDSVIRWRTEPSSSTKKSQGCPTNGCKADDVCYNYKSGCFNDPKRINNPANKCNFEIRAAAYNWSNPTMASWFLDDVVKPAMIHGDGIWLDGIGPDNGAYMCSGVCCGYGADNSPVTQGEIDSHCSAQAAATTQVQRWLIANGGWEAQACFNYAAPGGHHVVHETGVTDMGGRFNLPSASDSPTSCASKLQETAVAAADHTNYNFVVAYGSRTGGRAGYNDTTVAGTVAAFLLMRGQHWLLSIGPTSHTGSGGKSSPPYIEDPGTLLPATAKVLLSDYGRPKGKMTPVVGKANVFQREFESATVTLDCNTWTPTFDER